MKAYNEAKIDLISLSVADVITSSDITGAGSFMDWSNGLFE